MDFHEETLSQDFDFIEIKPISDVHIGDPNHDTDLIQKDIDWVAEKENRFAILNGDIMDTATERSVGNSYESTLTPQQQLEYARKLFSPIKGKILALSSGNHERRIFRDSGFDTTKELAWGLNCYYTRDGAILKIRFGQRYTNNKHQVYTIYFTHGFGGGRLPGGKANKCLRLRHTALTDIYIMGHVHEKEVFHKKVFIPDLRNNKAIEKRQNFIISSAYLKYKGYGQRKGYFPSDPGTVIIRLYGEKKKMEVIS